MQIKKILISRTDSIGDVILTLPITGILKEKFPYCKIHFLGKSYTQAVVDTCKHIDHFINYSKLAEKGKQEQIEFIRNKKFDTVIHVFPRAEIARLMKAAVIPWRIGTTNRLYHWNTCNKLLRFSRRKSSLHEAQLNTKLLKPFGIGNDFGLSELTKYFGIKNIPPLSEKFSKLLDQKKFNLILHPKSKGSAREWGIENFNELIKILPEDKIKIFITGTQQEGYLIRSFLLEKHKKITDLTGKMSLIELFSFIRESDGLIAASTGPLHIAAATGKTVIGIYPPIRPMHPGRWAPVGENAHYLVIDKVCSDCRKSGDCHCIRQISPEMVKNKLMEVIY